MASIISINGRWRACVRVKKHGELILNRAKTFDTKRQATAWAATLEAAIVDKGADHVAGVIKHQDITIRVLLTRFLAEFDKPPKVFGNTKRSNLITLADSSLGDVIAEKLNSGDVITWCRNKHEEDHVGASTLYQYITYLRLVLRAARPAWGLDNINTVAVDDALPLLKSIGLAGKGQERERRLVGNEYERLQERLTLYQNRPRAKNRHADVFAFAVASAFRLGEIVRITWDDIDAEKRTVLIRDRKDPQRKMGNHQRVPLLEEAWSIVQAQPKIEGENRIFPFITNAVSNAFAKACDSLNIIDLHFHDLRHEGASRLFEKGYEIQEVALITGHKNWNMLRRYTQLKAEDIHRN